MDKDFDYKDIMIPADIEKKSFEIITNELGDRTFDPEIDPVVKRVIHATADFDYADNLSFSEHAVRKMQNAIRNGASIVTDTNMAKAGINKKKLAEFGGEVYCFMADSDGRRSKKEKHYQGSSFYGKGSRAWKEYYFCFRKCADCTHENI